jgi:hypothetical protein
MINYKRALFAHVRFGKPLSAPDQVEDVLFRNKR